MRYAEVSVNSPVAQRRTFSYSIPPGMEIAAGQAVLVPFGERELQGIVTELTQYPAVEDTREISGKVEPELVLSPQHLQLARWISEHYLAPLFDAVALMLPPGFERRTITIVRTTGDEPDTSSLSTEQSKVIDMLEGEEGLDLRHIEKALGKRKAAAAVSQLVKKGLISRSYRLDAPRIKPKIELYLSLTESAKGAFEAAGCKQQFLIDFLKERAGPVPWQDIRKQTGCSKATANLLVKRGLAQFREVEVRREPITYNNIAASPSLTLTSDQRAAFEAIKASLETTAEKGASPSVFLLHGVTGSGKTEVYLRALAEAVKLGEKGIVLVPEIALTPQTIERFAARFPHRVAVFHSKLSPGEQYDEWHRIRNGEFDVVIGSRSAIFTPQPDTGLIILDEEHEWTYKQENSPHYHARDAAIKLAELTGATVVLGSATPDIGSYYRAERGEYRLLELPKRVVPYEGAIMPQVEVVDMREELKSGNRSIFSRSLSEAINEAIAGREQVILFLNRRGGATFVQCRRCGFVMRCRRCDVPLIQHISDDTLVCHQCNYKMPVPKTCPNCSSRQIKFLGTGTQKLEEEVGYTFPRARHLRCDSDAIGSKTANEEILRSFRNREAEILIGTQMVAKGLDMPAVTLVGVVLADISLNLPDFRAGERTFQLLSQVAGRAGRGPTGGRVIIQTYAPENYAIRAAAGHDYQAFYSQEITYRRELGYPPFTELARLVYIHTNDERCRREAERMKGVLLEESRARGTAGIEIAGPGPAYIHRLRGRYRWQLILKGKGLTEPLAAVSFPQGWTIDIDPVSLI